MSDLQKPRNDFSREGGFKGDEILDKIEKDKIRKKELNKLKKIFENLPEDKKKLAESLMQQAAFMVATLAELQERLDNDGAVELFEQGKQKLIREHPAAKTYNSMIRNYTTVCKQLIDLLPAGNTKTEDELMSFVKQVKK